MTETNANLENGNGENVENIDDQEGGANDEKQESSMLSGPVGFNSANGAFPSMAFGATGGFDQMQMMMAMQNGMPPNGFGFPMMGLCPLRSHPLFVHLIKLA